MKKIDKIVIVGGGSAGWMTAATLINAFPNKDITLVESPYVPTLGVGESTLNAMPAWLYSLGVKLEDFMEYTDASYKLSIKFNDFYEIGDGGYHYPFSEPFLDNCVMPGANDWHVLKHMVPETPKQDYVNSVWPNSVLLDSGKIYTGTELENFRFEKDNALHFDAIKFAEWLAEKYAKPRGVKHIEANVNDVVADSEGVKKLILEGGEELTADLFFDCTGFKSMLLGKAMNEPFVSYADKLPVNSTWAVQLQYEDAEKEIKNYTDCTALGNGWVWMAPLWSRIGTGYVYSDRFTTKEAALEEFKKHLRSYHGAHRITDDLKFREVPFRAGHYERTWVKNVIGIGMSAAFLEPLESNGIYFIHEHLREVVRGINRGFYNGIDRDLYNAYVQKRFDLFAIFIQYHYSLSKRNDTEFWNYMTNNDVTGDIWGGYNNHITLFGDKIEGQSYRAAKDAGFHAIAVGMEYYNVDMLTTKYWNWHFDTDYKKVAGEFYLRTQESRKKWLKAIENAPSHYQYLKDNFHSGK